MKQLKTYKYKLYNRDATKHLDRIIDLSSWIYNHCIALHRRYYRLYKKQLNKYQLQKHLKLGCLPGDDSKHIQEVLYRFGTPDKKNPRYEVEYVPM